MQIYLIFFSGGSLLPGHTVHLWLIERQVHRGHRGPCTFVLLRSWCNQSELCRGRGFTSLLKARWTFARFIRAFFNSLFVDFQNICRIVIYFHDLGSKISIYSFFFILICAILIILWKKFSYNGSAFSCGRVLYFPECP